MNDHFENLSHKKNVCIQNSVLTRLLICKTGCEIFLVCPKLQYVNNSVQVTYYFQSKITVCNSGHHSSRNIPQCNAVVL